MALFIHIFSQQNLGKILIMMMYLFIIFITYTRLKSSNSVTWPWLLSPSLTWQCWSPGEKGSCHKRARPHQKATPSTMRWPPTQNSTASFVPEMLGTPGNLEREDVLQFCREGWVLSLWSAESCWWSGTFSQHLNCREAGLKPLRKVPELT